MKIKIIVIDPELSTRTKRLLAAIAIPAVLLGGAAIAWAGTVHSWSSGDTLVAQDLNDSFAAVTTPPGTVIAYAGSVGGATAPPDGWLLADGSAVSRTTYAALFTVVGTTAGVGDGTTTFNLPDYRGYFLRGNDQGAGRDPDAAARVAMASGGNSGAKVNTTELHTFASHDHGGSTGDSLRQGGGFSTPMDYSGSGAVCVAYAAVQEAGCAGNSGAETHQHGITAAGGAETRPSNAAVNYLIKY